MRPQNAAGSQLSMPSWGLTVTDVSILQLPGVRYTVTYHLIYRGTTRLGKVEVVEWRGVAISLHACLVDQSINFIGSHSGSHGPGTYIQHFSPQLQAHSIGPAHQLWLYQDLPDMQL